MKSLQLTTPHAIMMVGVPGSGKTFFAEQFAEMFGLPYIDSLTIEDNAADEIAAGKLISLFVNEIAKTGQTFVYEGNTDTRTSRTEFARWAQSKGFKPLLVWVQIDQPTAKQRSMKHSGLTNEAFADMVKHFSPPHRAESPLVISGKHTFSTQLKVVLNQLAQSSRPNQKTMRIEVPERQQQASRRITIR